MTDAELLAKKLALPTTNADLFGLLARDRRLPESLAPALSRMAGFRNVLVHGSSAVDLAIVRDVVEHHLDDLIRFAEIVREQL